MNNDINRYKPIKIMRMISFDISNKNKFNDEIDYINNNNDHILREKKSTKIINKSVYKNKN